MRPLFLLLALALAVLTPPAVARAQGTGTDTDTDLQDFLPMGGPREFLTVPSPAVSPHRSVGFGLIVNYTHRPLVLVDPEGDETLGVGHQVTADFLWSFGLWDRLQLGLALPVVVSQDGEGISPIVCPDPDDCEVPELAATAIRDIRLDAKLRFARTGTASALALAVAVGIPTGDSDNFAGSDSASVVPMLLFGGLRPTPQIRVGAALGARIRDRTEVGDAKFGSELWGRVGAGWEIVPRLVVSAEYFGSLPITDGADGRQELLGALRYSPDRAEDVTLEIGAGGGLPPKDASAGTPGFRGIAGVSYAPLGRDTDRDGVPDRVDACITGAEDRDGFEDADGCPDPDNDGDEVPDARDGCDDEAEDRDGFADEDGCPDPDNDEDGVIDTDDQCPTDAEDRDEFEDEDGCPEPDDDGDGVPDLRDACPAEAEDRDGFEDDNGCPDPDNDGDQFLDANDRCPGDREDRDGFEDEDGCPDPDNDRDGVSDGDDRCNGEAETINGRDDDDGCPDPGRETFVWQDEALVTRGAGLRFGRGASVLPARAAALVPQLVQRVRSQAGARFIVVGYGDRPGDAEAERALALARAHAIRDALVAGGIGTDRIDVQVGQPPRAGVQFEVKLLVAVAPAAASPAPAPATGVTAPAGPGPSTPTPAPPPPPTPAEPAPAPGGGR